ncbi:MAG: hypothetical protein HKM95_08005 [Inquilinus sp.]|nr:hypothetical protein [Inquilinus sp.]
MAAFDSDQYARFRAAPRQAVQSNEWHGRVRRAYWSFTTPGGGLAVNDTINLAELPKDARILGGRTVFGAMSSGAGTATVSIGYAGAASRYASNLGVDAAGEADVADTAALNFGEALADKQTLVATVGGEAWAAAQPFAGYVEYMLD